MTERKVVRCGIYTRKSTEEGLEQEFNSLDAQYEACSAYIAATASRGRLEVTNADDPAFSARSSKTEPSQRCQENFRPGTSPGRYATKLEALAHLSL